MMRNPIDSVLAVLVIVVIGAGIAVAIAIIGCTDLAAGLDISLSFAPGLPPQIIIVLAILAIVTPVFLGLIALSMRR